MAADPKSTATVDGQCTCEVKIGSRPATGRDQLVGLQVHLYNRAAIELL